MKELVHTFGLSQSMSRADDPYDNAFAESLWSRLKIEMPKGGYENLEILRSILFEFIEGYYNRQRLHSSLKYEIPMNFETQWFEKIVKKSNYLTRKTRKKCKPKIDHPKMPINLLA